MNSQVKIRNGKTETTVNIGAFYTMYKSKGWEIVEPIDDASINTELEHKGITNENQQNAYIKAKNESARRKFSDHLFYSEG